MDANTLEQLVQEITQAIIDNPQPVPISLSAVTGYPGIPTDGCSTCEGQCVEQCPDKAVATLQAGATRITTQLGVNNFNEDLAQFIDHTLLKPQATTDEITQLCREAEKFEFASVCVNPTNVKLASQLLFGTPVKVCTVVGFPLGATMPEVKSFEAQQAINDGATEIDMVINIGALKSGDQGLVERDIAMVTRTSHKGGAICKVIIETALLTDDEKTRASQLARKAGADFVKTSTGFGGGGATVHDVALMRQAVGPAMGVKASGGIKGLEDARNLIAAGATRLGASAGVKIMQEARR